MKPGTLISSAKALPDHLQQKIKQKFPNKEFSDLAIRYYDSIEDVGYEYFLTKVLPNCVHAPTVQYLEPFISFTRLGEMLVLDTPESAVVYDTNNCDNCTETGPFWWVTLPSNEAS